MTSAYSYFSDSKQQAGNNDCVQHLENAHRKYMCTSESDILRSSFIFLICGRLEKDCQRGEIKGLMSFHAPSSSSRVCSRPTF